MAAASPSSPLYAAESARPRARIWPAITGPVHLQAHLNRSAPEPPDPCRRRFLSPLTTTTPVGKPFLSRSIRAVTLTAGPPTPLISPSDQWGMWTALLATGAFGIWSEKTKIGSALSGALVSTLVGLVASSIGIIAAETPAYKVVMEYLLPIAIPLLLFNADLRRVIRSTGMLLLAFLVGSVATIIGTVVAYLLVPMRSLGQDSWKIAAALMSRHIGGGLMRFHADLSVRKLSITLLFRMLLVLRHRFWLQD